MNPVIMLAAYVAAMGAIAALAGKARNSLEFHVADRNMGTLKSALSIGTTWVWAPALFVSAERAYTQGVVGLFWFLAPNVLCLILFIPFAKRIRSLMPQGVTLSGYMGERYGTGVKRAYLFQLSVLSVSSTGVNLLAGASVLHIFTGLPFPLLTVILAAVAFSYTWVSGFKASVLTDGVQMSLIAGVCLLLVSMSTGINGLGSAIAGLTGPGGEYGRIFSRTGLEVFLAFGIPSAIGLLSGPFGDQNFWQRAFAIRRDRIGRSFALGAMFFAVVPLSMAFLGYTAGAWASFQKTPAS